DSRPVPGPLTRTSISRTPIFRAFSAARSAARCAAKGVLFLEPVNPIVPAESQQRVSPLGSVNVTIVLLKLASTWTTARGTFRRTFFLPAMKPPTPRLRFVIDPGPSGGFRRRTPKNPRTYSPGDLQQP